MIDATNITWFQWFKKKLQLPYNFKCENHRSETKGWTLTYCKNPLPKVVADKTMPAKEYLQS